MINTKTNISEESIERTAYILKTIAHPLRLKIIYLLGEKGPLSVNDICKHLSSDQSLTSHHLSMMKLKGVLNSKREGQKHIYSLAVEQILSVFDCLQDCDCNY